MDIRKLLVLIGIGVILFVGAWAYLIFSVLFSSPDIKENQANIISSNISGAKNAKVLTEKIENSNQLDQKSVLKGDQTNIVSGSKQILLVMPKYFYNNAFKLFKRQFEKNGIKIKYIFYDDFVQLRRYLLLNKFDMYLLPLEYVQDYVYKFEKIQIKNSEKYRQKLHPLFIEHFFSNNYTFFPFGIDVIATFIYKDLQVDYPLDIFEIRKTFVKNRQYYKPLAVLFGIDKIVVSNYLLKGKEIYPDYNIFLYYLLYYVVLTGDERIITTIISWSEDSKMRLWSYAHFLRNKKILSKQNKYCNTFPKLCMASYGKSYLFFGRLSDLDKFITYFPKASIKYNQWEIANFPYYNANIYPVSLWGFVINKNSSNKGAALQVLSLYMNNYNKYFWKNILSAFEDIYETQKLSRKYVKLIDYEYDFEPIVNIKKINQILKNNKLVDVIEGRYNLKLLINDPGFVDLIVK